MKSVLILGVGILLSSAAIAQQPDMFGAYFLSGGSRSLDSTTGTVSNLGNTGYPQIQGMAHDGAGTYYGFSGPQKKLISMDPRTGCSVEVSTVSTTVIRALAWHSAGTLWVIEDGGFGNNDRLKTLDIATGITTTVGTSNHEKLEGLAKDSFGTLYGYDADWGLVTIDTATGASTDVNVLMDGISLLASISFAPNGDLFRTGTALYSIDQVTGTTTQIGAGGFLDMKASEFYDYAPNECMLLEANNVAGGMTATFTVTGPADGATVAIVYSLFGGETIVNGFSDYCATFGLGNLSVANLVAQGQVVGGSFVANVNIPPGAVGLVVFFQAAERNTCPGECVSNLVATVVQ